MPLSESLRARLSPPRRAIEHGPWCVVLATDELVDLRWRGHTVLRGIRAAIRDADWRTLRATVTDVTDVESEDCRQIKLSVDYSGWGQTYSAVVALRLSDDAAQVEFDGQTDDAFRGNRIGLVVLHEPSDAGAPVAITAPDGSEAASEFPTDIGPHQPFVNIAGMWWRHDGLAVSLQFSGDTFETEDQRNWTDASYKTYGTPLAAPYPVDHAAGSTVHQCVTVRVESDAAFSSSGRSRGLVRRAARTEVAISNDVVGRVPAIGVAASTDAASEEAANADSVCTGTTSAATGGNSIEGLDALLVELTGTIDERRNALASARREAELLDVQLDLRIVADDAAELAATLELVSLATVARIGVFDPRTHVSEPELWSALKAEAEHRHFAGELVAGARSHFTELNRTAERLPADAASVVFSMTPQMHATEVERIVQTLPMQRVVADNALRIGGGRPLHIGPITLRPRFNAVATGGGYDEATRLAMITDELQSSDFTAAWTLGSVAALSGQGIASISYFETTGPRGIDGSDGTPYPVGHLIRALAGLRGRDVLRVESAGARFEGTDETLIVYPVSDQSHIIVFVANLSNETRRVSIHCAGTESNLDLEPWATQTLTVPA